MSRTTCAKSILSHLTHVLGRPTHKRTRPDGPSIRVSGETVSDRVKQLSFSCPQPRVELRLDSLRYLKFIICAATTTNKTNLITRSTLVSETHFLGSKDLYPFHLFFGQTVYFPWTTPRRTYSDLWTTLVRLDRPSCPIHSSPGKTHRGRFTDRMTRGCNINVVLPDPTADSHVKGSVLD